MKAVVLFGDKNNDFKLSCSGLSLADDGREEMLCTRCTGHGKKNGKNAHKRIYFVRYILDGSETLMI